MGQQANTRMDIWTARLQGLPRGVRMLLAAIIALLSGGLVSQLAGLLMGPEAMIEPASATLALLIAGGAGIVVYIVGWWSLIGFGGEPDLPLGRRAVYFALFGALVLLALVIWLVISLVIAALPPQIPI